MRLKEANYIWTMWWQGDDNAPLLVKKCIASMKQYANGAIVIVITKDNFSDYISIPSFVLEKVDEGIISITHLSDIIRFELINNYGGIWIDSTVYVNNPIQSEIFDLDFYSIKMKYDEDSMIRNIAKARWSTYLIGGKKHNVVSENVIMLFYTYWKSETVPISYFLLDYFIEYIIDNNKFAYELWNKIDSIDYDIFYMHSKLNDINFDLSKIGTFNKLSWKDSYIPNKDNKMTLYGKMFGINNNEKKEKISKWNKFTKYFKECFNSKYVSSFGIKIAILSFLHLCVQVKKGKIFCLIDNYYNKAIKTYISKNYNFESDR